MRFTTLAALANELQEAESRRELGRVVARYARIELLILDELGYLALPDGAAELVFQVISERHERASLIITTNLPFGEWGRVFPDPRLAKAVVDRVTHRAHIIDCGTQSWRFTHGLKTPRQARPRGSARLPRDPTDRSSDTPTREHAITPKPTSPGGATSSDRGGASAGCRTQLHEIVSAYRLCVDAAFCTTRRGRGGRGPRLDRVEPARLGDAARPRELERRGEGADDVDD